MIGPFNPVGVNQGMQGGMRKKIIPASQYNQPQMGMGGINPNQGLAPSSNWMSGMYGQESPMNNGVPDSPYPGPGLGSSIGPSSLSSMLGGNMGITGGLDFLKKRFNI